MSFSLAALKSDTTVLGGIKSSSVSPGLQMMLEGGSGQVYKSYGAVDRLAPVAEFSSININALLAFCGVAGLAINATPLELYFVEDEEFVSRKTTGVKMTLSKGVLFPRSVSGPAIGPATITYGIALGGFAGAAPFSIGIDQEVPTGANVPVIEMFKGGPLTINEVDAGPVEDGAIDFNFTIREIFGSGAVYSQRIHIEDISPRMRFTVLDAETLNTVGLTGSNLLVTWTLLACTRDGGRTGSGDIVFSTHQNNVRVEGISGAHGGGVSSTLIVDASWDGTNTPITVG